MTKYYIVYCKGEIPTIEELTEAKQSDNSVCTSQGFADERELAQTKVQEANDERDFYLISENMLSQVKQSIKNPSSYPWPHVLKLICNPKKAVETQLDRSQDDERAAPVDSSQAGDPSRSPEKVGKEEGDASRKVVSEEVLDVAESPSAVTEEDQSKKQSGVTGDVREDQSQSPEKVGADDKETAGGSETVPATEKGNEEEAEDTQSPEKVGADDKETAGGSETVTGLPSSNDAAQERRSLEGPQLVKREYDEVTSPTSKSKFLIIYSSKSTPTIKEIRDAKEASRTVLSDNIFVYEESIPIQDEIKKTHYVFLMPIKELSELGPGDLKDGEDIYDKFTLRRIFSPEVDGAEAQNPDGLVADASVPICASSRDGGGDYVEGATDAQYSNYPLQRILQHLLGVSMSDENVRKNVRNHIINLISDRFTKYFTKYSGTFLSLDNMSEKKLRDDVKKEVNKTRFLEALTLMAKHFSDVKKRGGQNTTDPGNIWRDLVNFTCIFVVSQIAAIMAMHAKAVADCEQAQQRVKLLEDFLFKNIMQHLKGFYHENYMFSNLMGLLDEKLEGLLSDDKAFNHREEHGSLYCFFISGKSTSHSFILKIKKAIEELLHDDDRCPSTVLSVLKRLGALRVTFWEYACKKHGSSFNKLLGIGDDIPLGQFLAHIKPPAKPSSKSVSRRPTEGIEGSSPVPAAGQQGPVEEVSAKNDDVAAAGSKVAAIAAKNESSSYYLASTTLLAVFEEEAYEEAMGLSEPKIQDGSCFLCRSTTSPSR